jgi:DNA-binding SARP family transcriptional activator
MTDLKICVLGPVEALRGGTPLALGGRTTLTVLASLAVARGQISSIDTLVDHVWGTDLPANPRAALHNGISRLRRPLGDDVVRTVGWGYQLRVDAEDLDIARFDQQLIAARQAAARHEEAAITALDAALALWREPILGNVVSRSLHDEVVPRLTDRYLEAVELRAELCLRSGRHRMLAEELAGIAHAHPLRERLAGQLMIALAGAGRQVDALITYDTLRRTLREELGIDPTPRLQELHVRILRAEVPAAYVRETVFLSDVCRTSVTSA